MMIEYNYFVKVTYINIDECFKTSILYRDFFDRSYAINTIYDLDLKKHINDMLKNGCLACMMTITDNVRNTTKEFYIHQENGKVYFKRFE